MKEVTEALHRLAQALERHEQLAQGAQAHNVQDEGDQEAVARALRRQGEDIRGTGEALGEFTAPHLLIDSAAGIQTSAAGSTQQASGEHHAIASGGHTSIAAGGSHHGRAFARRQARPVPPPDPAVHRPLTRRPPRD